MKIHLIFIFVFLIINTLEAQNENQLPQTGLKVAYMGSIIYPGFKIGIERPSKIIVKEKKRKTILKERYWAYNFGFYHHTTLHTNFYMLAERQMRRQQPKGFFYELAGGLGYSRTFLDGATYRVDNEGQVSKKNLAGYNYGLLSLSSGVGYDFSKKCNLPAKVYLKASAVFLAPYNSFVYARPTAELGLIFSIKNFWKANPAIKKIGN